MSYRVKVRGKGYEELQEAYNAETLGGSNRCHVQIGTDIYLLKNERMAKIDPDTGKRIGKIQTLEKAIGDKSWTIKWSG